MVKKHLSDSMIRSGTALIQQMDAHGLNPEAVFWLYDSDPDYRMWKLVIAMADLDKIGRFEGYRRIRQIFATLPVNEVGLELDDITLVRPNEQPVPLLRRLVAPDRSPGGLHTINRPITGGMVEDSYVYRLA